jgi:hypothetical protein
LSFTEFSGGSLRTSRPLRLKLLTAKIAKFAKKITASLGKRTGEILWLYEKENSMTTTTL